MQIIPKLTIDKIKFDQDNEVHLVLTLKAPVVNWQARRTPVCLMLVLDVSGSMASGKLDEAKKSAVKIIDNLKEGDFCGVATFGDRPHLISKPIVMSEVHRTRLKAIVSDITTAGYTNFSGGLLMGLAEVNKPDLPQGMIIRQVMLTDGHANLGVTDLVGLSSLLNTNKGSATVSAFGYGEDANQDLLTKFAQQGRGNYAFISKTEFALETFARELGGLLSMYARNIAIELDTSDYSATLVTDLPSETKEKKLCATVSDIIGEETRPIVFSFKVPCLSQADELLETVRRSLANIKVTYECFKDEGGTEIVTETFASEIEFVNSGDESSPDKSLDEIVAKAQMIRAQLDAQAKADVGDYEGAVQVMSLNSSDLGSRGHLKLSKTSSKIGSNMSSNQVYAASSSYRASTYSVGTRSITSGSNVEALEDVQLDGDLNTNTAQDAIVESFAESDPDGSTP